MEFKKTKSYLNVDIINGILCVRLEKSKDMLFMINLSKDNIGELFKKSFTEINALVPLDIIETIERRENVDKANSS